MLASTRRRFLALSAASYARIRGANDRIRLGGIGCGGRGRWLLKIAAGEPQTEIVALCDVYQPHMRRAQAEIAPGAALYPSYRQLLDRPDIDAVIIATPDHWHVPMTLDAMAAGKDVYVEKPVSHTIEEGERLRIEAARSRQVVQVGYQQRSWRHFQQAREVVASGELGVITLVLTSWYQGYLTSEPPQPKLNLNELDWAGWLGSASQRPVSPLLVVRWRWFWDFGGGHLTDLFSHWCDTVHWFLGLKRPRRAQAMGGNYLATYIECPDTINACWDYKGQLLLVYNGAMNGRLEGGNIVFRGERAVMRLNRDGFTVYPEGVLPAENTRLPEPILAARSTGDGTVDHVRNFLECIRSRRQPNSTVEDAVDAANVAHLGNLAYRRQKPLTWEEATGKPA